VKSKLILLVLSTICLLFWACGGSKQMTQTEEKPDVLLAQNESPQWFTNVPQDPNFLYAPATATSKDLQMSVNKAQQQGRLGIANVLETRFQGLNKQFQQETGLGEQSEFAAQTTVTIKEVVSITLTGCKTKTQITKKEGELWRAWVLMEYPIGEANAKFLQALKERDILRQKVAATEAFKELEAEVEKYEQEKEKKNK